MSLFDSAAFNERLFFPRRDTSPPPAGAVDLDLDGLHIRCYAADSGCATLLLFHGNGEVVADYDDSVELFAKAGCNLVVMDYCGYGRSTGTPTLRGSLADASRVLEVVRARTAGALIVMGRSLGSACANELYGRTPAGVAGFVLESGFVDLAALIRRRGLEVPQPLPPEDAAVFDPVPKLARGTLPLLVLHGERDTLIVPAEGQRAHAAAGTTDKQLVIVPARGHNDISLSPVYWDALARFVSRLR